MKLLYIAALSFTLSGCWSGPGFYTLSESEAAIPAGKYEAIHTYDNQVAEEGPFGNALTISYTPDGQAVVKSLDGDDSTNSTLVKLGDDPGIYVVQANLGAAIPKVGSAIYGLVELLPNGYRIAMPKCDQRRLAQWDRVIVSGLLVGKPICRFSSRDGFESAMLEYAKNPVGWTEYRRVQFLGNTNLRSQ